MAEMLIVGNAVRRNRKFYDRINPLHVYDDTEFLSRFRLTKPTFQEILNLLAPTLERDTMRSRSLTPLDQFSAALRYYATGSFQLVMSDTCGLSQPSISNSISAVSNALDGLWNDTIHFPIDNNQIANNKHHFYELAQFPNVIGCIDGTHIPILRPKDFEWQYVNRKFYHSLNVQAVCDQNRRFINMVVMHPGSAHDSFILRNSELWTYMENNPNAGYILGDSAYPCRRWLMTPLTNPQTVNERNYNYAHKRTRVLIENTFGIWKQRFAMLKTPNRRKLENIAVDIRATAILHNFAIRQNDPLPEDNMDFIGLNDDQPDMLVDNVHVIDQNSGFATRLHLINHVFVGHYN